MKTKQFLGLVMIKSISLVSDSNYVSDMENFFFSDNTIAGQTLESLHVKSDDVINAISQTNPNFAPGPDGILSLLLIKCVDELS